MENFDENILTGSLLTEDYFDNLDNSDIASVGTSSGDVIEDEGCRMEFQIEVVRGAKFSFKSKALILEKILKMSPIFFDAKVAACELKDNIDKEREKKEWQRHEIPSDVETIWKYIGDYRPTDVGVTVSFDVSLVPVHKCTYKKFYKYMEELKEELGRHMPYHPDNETRMYIYNTREPEEYAEFIITAGYTHSDDEMKKTYEVLFNESPSDKEFEFNAYRLIENMNFMQKVRNSVDAYNKTDDRSYTFEVGTPHWLTEDSCVIPVNLDPYDFEFGNEEKEQNVGYIIYLLERVIGRVLPDVLLRYKKVGLSVRVNVDEIEGINNKSCVIVGRNGCIPSRNGKDIAEAYYNSPVTMTRNNKRYETNRFQDIMYMRHNTNFYILFPLKNGYLAKNPDELDVVRMGLDDFIKNKI